jgi:glycerophosphoryl diester phosphodiesterase
MKKWIWIGLFSLVIASCKNEYKVVMPDATGWDLFNTAGALPLAFASRNAMEGVYTLSNGSDIFGELSAIKWSYILKNADTVFHVSGFFGKDIAYFIGEGKKLNGSILINGYWRKMVSTETGLIRLTISAENGANILLGANPIVAPGSITIDGFFGNQQQEPVIPITFKYTRKLNNSPSPFRILAHRSGGRTSDLLSVSENSVEMILKTPEFGSTGIEIDVRLTKDGIPILYHDNTINLRVTQKSGLLGPVENYTYEQLSTFVRLIHGEKIPKLTDALETVVYKTGLNFVWLDTKFIGSLDIVRAIQKEYLQKAAAAGRTLQIVIGLPGTVQLEKFLALPDYTLAPSLCELSLNDLEKSKAIIWAPRFTQGTQNDNVALVHQQGKQAFVWTLDVPEFITSFINEGHFDGILTNFPSCVAYNYYVH